VTKRNDSRLNNHQQLQLQGWRANCDIQVVIDHYACVEYLTKYAAKGEPRSPILKQAFNSIVQNVDSNTDPHRVIKKIVMKSLGERDYAAQETMHHLLSLKLHSSSFKVMPLSLNGSRRVRDTASIDEGESCTDYSLLDVYANREQYDSSQNIINMNFVQFATTYKVVNNELTKLPENIIPQIFPTYSPNSKGTNFGLYCKYQLLRYKPWRATQNNAWGDQEPTDEVLINFWHEFYKHLMVSLMSQTGLINYKLSLKVKKQKMNLLKNKRQLEKSGWYYQTSTLLLTTLNKHQSPHMTGNSTEPIIQNNKFKKCQHG
jgi:hypothetical protein